ncbi:Protoporphyrinogen oxidase [Halotydeus destructor]|nr:Protoporphyrinogen oxidase [Halotydeus destructor]
MAKNPVVILGGGISGLSMAYYLQKFGKSFLDGRKVVLLEGSKQFGGWLQTQTYDNCVSHELGPRSIRNAPKLGMNTLAMIEDIGLPHQVVGISSKEPSANKRLIYANGKLNLVPNSLGSFLFKKEPFSKSMLSALIHEYRTPPIILGEKEDISFYDFVRIRFGKDFAEYMADPLCRGITAGDCRKLGVKGLFPELYALQKEAGSLIRAKLSKLDVSAHRHVSVEYSHLYGQAEQEKWSMFSFKDGLKTFSQGLCNYLLELPGRPVSIHNETKVTSLISRGPGEPIRLIADTPTGEVDMEADHVFSCLPSHNLAEILTRDEDIANKLKKIESVDVAVVCLEYEGKDIVKPDAGFGFLVPSFEDCKLLGVTFDSCTLPVHDAGHDITRLTCMMGGQWFNELFGPADQVSERDLLKVAVTETAKILGFKKKPIRSIVQVHKKCIAQYRLNHRTLVEEIKEDIASKGMNLELLGSSYFGFSVNECIFNARSKVQELSRSSNSHQDVSESEAMAL